MHTDSKPDLFQVAHTWLVSGSVLMPLRYLSWGRASPTEVALSPLREPHVPDERRLEESILEESSSWYRTCFPSVI